MTFEPIREIQQQDVQRLFDRVVVSATTEFAGRKLSAMLVVDEQAWQYPAVRDEVFRRLREKIAEEVGKRLDVQFTVQS